MQMYKDKVTNAKLRSAGKKYVEDWKFSSGI